MAARQNRAETTASLRASRAELIERHLPLVESIARRFARRGEPLEDLVQIGTIGLIKAVDRFDPARGNKLSTVAVPAIEGEIRHHLRDGASLVRTPQPLQDLAGRLNAERPRMTADLGREPTAAELAGAVGASAQEAGLALSSRAPQGLEDADGASLAASTEHAAESRLLLDGGLDALPEREQRIVRLRYEQDLSQAEIARREGVSQATVSRLLQGALDQLRVAMSGGESVAGGADGAYSRPVEADEKTPAAEPEKRPAHSGRLLVRMPASLHDELASAAEREGVSLNTLVTGALAGAVGWRDQNGADSFSISEHDDPRTGRPAWIRYALLANVVVVAVAAIVAIALLVTAL